MSSTLLQPRTLRLWYSLHSTSFYCASKIRHRLGHQGCVQRPQKHTRGYFNLPHAMPGKQSTLGSFFTQPAVHAANGQKPAVDLSSRTRTITKTAEAGIAAVPTDIDETTTRKETVPPDAVTVDGTGAHTDTSSSVPLLHAQSRKRTSKSDHSSDEELPTKRSRRIVADDVRTVARASGKESKGSATRQNDGAPLATKAKRGQVKKAPSNKKNLNTAKAISEKASITSADEDGRNSPVSGKHTKEDEPSKLQDDETSSEEEEKPEIVAKVREKVQATLDGGSNSLYPDWPAGDPVPYAALCKTFSVVEMTTKRLEISAHCALFLRQVLRLTPNDLLPTVLLMINKLAADYSGIELGIGESLIMKAIAESTGRTLSVIKVDQNEIGDLGLVAAKSRSNQPTMFKPKPLTVLAVHEGLKAIAAVEGQGAQGRKIAGIKRLLSAADAALSAKGSNGIDITKDKGGSSEAKFIVRTLEGKLRLGLAEKTVLVALAQAMVMHELAKEEKRPTSEQLAEGESILKFVYSELPSYEAIIPAMLEHGIFKLRDQCKLRPGVPLKPMLAKPTKSITEVLDRFEGKNFSCEFKYDGERAQIHFVAHASSEQYASDAPLAGKTDRGIANIFSRNSEDLSKKYPDVLEKLPKWIQPEVESFVLDCESVAWDVRAKMVLPFQQLMTRKRKDVKADEITVKVCIFAFDILYLNGEALVTKPFRERRELLHSSFTEVEGEFAFARYGDTNDLEQIQDLLTESVRASCEGLMVKMLDGPESKYEPSRRSQNWLKVKKDYLSGVGDSLDLVVLGAYFGKGKRTSVYGAFLLGCYNPTSQSYESVCNIGTGFSEAILESIHARLKEQVIDRPKPFYSHSVGNKDQPDVWFEPRVVWEVKTADLTLSPRYRAAADQLASSGGKGISLRFPRFINERDDKRPEQATTSRMVAEMYQRQDSVGKSKGPSADDDFEY